jgi:hypothetical protein
MNKTALNLPSGVDLMMRINDGLAVKAPTEYVQKIKAEVTDACDELLDFGARIRPLIVDKTQIGWVRGFHGSERRILNRWVYSSNDYIAKSLAITTTLTTEEIEDLTALEIKNLVELVRNMTDYDFSLYPYLSAFSTTSASENLWNGKGGQIASFENRKVEMPDGKVMTIMAPSDHARLWSTLCVYREQAKRRLDANFNAVLIIRPWAGKSVDPLNAELKGIARQLRSDSMEAWENLITVEDKRNLDDGWAHPDNLDTREGMLKELHGMLNNDKHEQLMGEFYRKQVEEAEAQKRQIEESVNRRGGIGINEETIVVETEEAVLQRERDLKQGRVNIPVNRDTEKSTNPRDRMNRYNT